MARDRVRTVYIARQLGLGNWAGDVSQAGEAVFSSWEKARQYLRSMEETETPQEMTNYRNVIVEAPVDALTSSDACAWPREWTFTVDGMLHQDSCAAPADAPDFELYTHEQLFSPGDIVLIKSNIEEPLSPFVYRIYGVVRETPVPKDKWIADGHAPEEWCGEYTLQMIDPDDGKLDHVHLPECCLAPFGGELPNECKFIEIYANHLKGIELLRDEDLDLLVNCKVFVKNVPVFNFTECTVVCLDSLGNTPTKDTQRPCTRPAPDPCPAAHSEPNQACAGRVTMEQDTMRCRCLCGRELCGPHPDDLARCESYALIADADYMAFLSSEFDALRAANEKDKLGCLARSAAYVGSLIRCPDCSRLILRTPQGELEYYRREGAAQPATDDGP